MIFLYLISFLLLTISFFLTAKTFIIAYTLITEVPYLPSTNKEIREIDKILNIKNGDNVLDIGSGDGKVVLYLSKKYPNVYFTGIDRNLILIYYSKLISIFLGRKNTSFIHANALTFDYSRYNKIYMYLIPDFIDRVMIKLEKDIDKGTVVISNRFLMGYIFSKTHNITKYPVKYVRKLKYIYRWIKE
jgi:SAM-dependent methyltransferase